MIFRDKFKELVKRELPVSFIYLDEDCWLEDFAQEWKDKEVIWIYIGIS